MGKDKSSRKAGSPSSSRASSSQRATASTSAGRHQQAAQEAAAAAAAAARAAATHAQAQVQYAAEFSEQLRRAHLHHQNGQVAQGRQQAEEAVAAAAAAANQPTQPTQQPAQRQGQGQGQDQRRPARQQCANPDFLDMFGNYVFNKTDRQQREWLNRHGLAGADPRQQPMYPLLPAAMRENYERRKEAADARARRELEVRA